MKWTCFTFHLMVAGLAGLHGSARGEEPAQEPSPPSSIRVSPSSITVGNDEFFTLPRPKAIQIEKKPSVSSALTVDGQKTFSAPFGISPRVQWLDQQGRILELSGIGDGNEMGVTLEPVDGALRTQLGLPEGQGVVVTFVAPEGPAARVGLNRNDLLLNLDDKPLAKPTDLTEHLKAAGDKPVTIRLLRGGKTVFVSAKPVYRVTLGTVAKEPRDYYIGVTSEPVDEALRSQLNLPPEGGVVARNIEPESPAAKAGLKTYDILISIDEQKLRDLGVFVEQVRASKGKPLQVKLLRGGKPLSVEVTPVIRPDTNSNPTLSLNHPVSVYRVIRSAPSAPAIGTQATTLIAGTTATATSTEKQLEEVVKELKVLHQVMEKLQSAIEEKKAAGHSEK